MAKAKTEADLNEMLQAALEDIARLSPNRSVYDRLTTVMFQLYAGNEMGLTYGASEFLAMVQKKWNMAQRARRAKLGLRIVK